ncbi:MAG: hypothetical protein U0694_15360 [Anaerolineae bacterium]
MPEIVEWLIVVRHLRHPSTAAPLAANHAADDQNDPADDSEQRLGCAAAHALQAIRNAHADAHTLYAAMLSDIGLIATWGSGGAHTYRTTAIPNSANALQPYAQVRPGLSGIVAVYI